MLVVGRNALTEASDFVLVAPLVERSRVPATPLPCHVVILDTGSELDKWVVMRGRSSCKQKPISADW